MHRVESLEEPLSKGALFGHPVMPSFNDL